MGITDEDGTSVKEAYDTLKEVANWIDNHGEVAAAFTNDIAALKTAVGNEESGLIKAVADLQASMEDADMEITQLQTAVQALESAINDAEAGLAKRVEELESTVDDMVELISDGETGLMSRVQKLEAKATNVTASETNGNIMVDGEEVTVYTHPETHSADMIVENDNRQFVTAAEKATFAAAAAITLVSSQEEVVNEKDLYMVEIV
jgi:chromosome segregation ATPase